MLYDSNSPYCPALLLAKALNRSPRSLLTVRLGSWPPLSCLRFLLFLFFYTQCIVYSQSKAPLSATQSSFIFLYRSMYFSILNLDHLPFLLAWQVTCPCCVDISRRSIWCATISALTCLRWNRSIVHPYPLIVSIPIEKHCKWLLTLCYKGME
jgi:hypothetical protein